MNKSSVNEISRGQQAIKKSSVRILKEKINCGLNYILVEKIDQNSIFRG